MNTTHINAKILKSENSVLTSWLHELSNNNHDHDRLKNDKLIAEISKIESSISSLHAKNNELSLKIDDMTCKILVLTSENRNL